MEWNGEVVLPGKRRPRFRHIWTNSVFVLPAFVIFTLFTIYPILSSFYYSLTDWNGLNPQTTFVGFDNFSRLIADSAVWSSLKTTLVYAIVVMVLQNGIALLLAVLVDSVARIFAALRVLFLIPTLLSSLAIGYIWSYMFGPLFGFINTVLTTLGLSSWTHDWLGDPHFALPSIIFTNTWQWSGFSMIIFLAGLQTVPIELKEASHIDGATSWQRFFRVTLPLIAPAITINTILTLVGSLKVFDIIFVMTNGGPGSSTESLTLHLYKEAFTSNHFGYASAIGIVMSLGILLLSVLNLTWLRRREVEY